MESNTELKLQVKHLKELNKEYKKEIEKLKKYKTFIRPITYKVDKEGNVIKTKSVSRNITKHCSVKCNTGKVKIEVVTGVNVGGEPYVCHIDVNELNKKESVRFDFFTKKNEVTKDNLKKPNPLPTFDEKCRDMEN